MPEAEPERQTERQMRVAWVNARLLALSGILLGSCMTMPSEPDATYDLPTGATDVTTFPAGGDLASLDLAAPDLDVPDLTPPPDLMPDQCKDGIKDGKESDVDCGGPDCAPCPAGPLCGVGGDCVSLVCTQGTCRAPTCTDNVKNGDETDIDCGGLTCPRCADGKSCLIGWGCASGVCNLNSHTCSAPTCMDGVKNGVETDVDCGGPCPPCGPKMGCVKDGDCAIPPCQNGLCFDFCSDGKLDHGESDVDCGGPCAPCLAGKRCITRDDCDDLVCFGGVCDTCHDGYTDGDETFTDCGGAHCPACANASPCFTDRDCQSGSCDGGVCGNRVGCHDGKRDNKETDVDCGGPLCLRCREKQRCSLDDDCMGGVCLNGLCGPLNCGCTDSPACDRLGNCLCDERSTDAKSCCEGAFMFPNGYLSHNNGVHRSCGVGGSVCARCSSMQVAPICDAAGACWSCNGCFCVTPFGEPGGAATDAACGPRVGQGGGDPPVACVFCPRFTRCVNAVCTPVK
jgi:hypothetical protein